MLDSLITSKTRIKLLMKFFINSETTAYLRNLSGEFGESTNGIRMELNRFEEASLIESELVQNKKVYKANIKHPYFGDIHHLLMKYVGIDQIIDEVVTKVGELQKAFIINDFAMGKPGKILDLLLVGKQLNQDYLQELVRAVEKKISFKVRYLTVTPEEAPDYIPDKTRSLLIWSAGAAETVGIADAIEPSASQAEVAQPHEQPCAKEPQVQRAAPLQNTMITDPSAGRIKAAQ
jgi:hypothetical protein